MQGGTYNYGGYSNAQVEALVDKLRGEADPTQRQTISRQVQELVKSEVPNIYLAAPPIITAARKGKVRGFTPHPDDLYFIDRALGTS